MQYFDIFHRIMGKGRFVLLLLLLVYFTCFPYPVAFGDDKASGNAVLEQSIQSVLHLKTIESDVRMSIWVDGTEFSARGRYEEQAAARATGFLRSMYRLDVNFLSDIPAAPGSEPNRMTLVCHLDADRDKNQIWQYTSIEGVKTFNTVKVSQLENAIKSSKKEAFFGPVSAVKNLGGLAAQLKQLSYFYDFASLETGNTDSEPAQPVLKLSGSVKNELFEKLIARFGGVDKKKRYPSDFPSDVEIQLGKDNLFPYKIVYYNRPAQKSPKRTVLYQASYFNTVLNGREIPAEHFSAFAQGEHPEGVFSFQDITASVIRSLGLQ